MIIINGLKKKKKGEYDYVKKKKYYLYFDLL